MAQSEVDYDAAMFVEASTYRVDVMKDLRKRPATPTEIEESTGLSVAHVSRALQELREKDMADLLVSDDVQKGRLYGITEQGEEALEFLENRK